MNQIYLYKSVAKTISYDDTHWYLNGVPKRLEGDDSSGRIKQFAIDEAYKAAAEDVSLYSVHFKNIAVLTAAGTSMENGSNCDTNEPPLALGGSLCTTGVHSNFRSYSSAAMRTTKQEPAL